ncbi:NAD(P)H-hydrate dehydratase [Candidatus Marithrix sp. Canyon 246]|uniref:NAD(P)H-hydrate dehydratase n=1 Tax=Candidatus Marithrix sp. Canyon 246 TaxID=1827136 RepID=UPI000849EE8D|nr:NAD(P)H-hydrate dehydratase [Candidatus Marithrix sp. Canyon 246]
MKKQHLEVLYTAAQVAELDRITIEDHNIPGLCLMERAGSAAFEVLKSHWVQARRITVVCGIGNNAGDGYVLARLAHLAGYDVSVLQLGDVNKLKADALLAYQYMINVGLQVQDSLVNPDVIVDAIFGTGLDRQVSGIWREAIDSINDCSCPVLSIDIPSGLDADTGNALGVAVAADVCVTFIGFKQGLFTGLAADCCGKIYFDDLKVPSEVYQKVESSVNRIVYDASLYPKRVRTAHKGKFGHVLIIGGDYGMIGAAHLAAEAAARVGAGKVSVATRANHAALLSITRPEIMSHSIETVAELESLLDQIDTIAIGPGLGQSDWGRNLLNVLKTIEKPIVVDADGLNLLAQKPMNLANAIFTPHPGEAARLLKKNMVTDRFTVVRRLTEQLAGVCVLKGAGTLVANKDEISVCTAGNPGMACGGMGDVLTGIIVGLVAQGFSNFEAAKLAVCLHAQAADRAAEENGERGLLPSDLFKWIQYYANNFQC